jgi:tetratricopeptide (TPR) repeat protein
MFRSVLAMRTKRVLLCIKRSVIKAAAFVPVSMTAIMIYEAVKYKGGSVSRLQIIEMLIFSFLFFLIAFSADSIAKYKGRLYHLYDEELIGKAFTGLKRSSITFEQALELFHKNDFRMALEMFTDLENSGDKLSQQETAILEFYRGRCYHILDTFPNAILCYWKAKEGGFYIPEMSIFEARCHVGSGNYEKAEALYKELMTKDYKYRDRIRCELGNMYLKMDDGLTALKWFGESIEKHENYASAVGGAAIAQAMLGNTEKSAELYRLAILNNIDNADDFKHYYRGIIALRKNDKKEE